MGRACSQPERARLLLGRHEVVEALHDLRALDDISLLEIGEEARALDRVPEARVPAVEQVLARGGEVGVEEQPEELRRAGVGVVLLSRHAERAVGIEGEGGRVAATAVVVEGGAVDRRLVVLDEDLKRHGAHLLGGGVASVVGLLRVAQGWGCAFGVGVGGRGYWGGNGRYGGVRGSPLGLITHVSLSIWVMDSYPSTSKYLPYP